MTVAPRAPMTRWKDTLPYPQGSGPRSYFAAALANLAEALEAEDEHHDAGMLMGASFAAAEIRAWRKSLPEQGKRIEDYGSRSSWPARPRSGCR